MSERLWLARTAQTAPGYFIASIERAKDEGGLQRRNCVTHEHRTRLSARTCARWMAEQANKYLAESVGGTS